VTAPLSRRSAFAFACLAFVACNGGDSSVDPFFPTDFETSYTEVYGCMRSGDHDLNQVRILTDDGSTTPWRERVGAFPIGAVILKPEYADVACTDVVAYTVMRKAEAIVDGGWEWQRLDRDLKETDYDLGRCESCHRSCPGGYDWTCTEIRN
jgi:hypothetical protein